MSARLRHWKQRFDPTAKFVFLRRMKLGLDPAHPVAMPGDVVPTGDVRIAGRLKRWWNAGFIGLAGWEDPADRMKSAKEKQREDALAMVEQLRGLLSDRAELLAIEGLDHLDEEEAADLARVEGVVSALSAKIDEAVRWGILSTGEADTTPKSGVVTTLEEAQAQGVEIEQTPDGGFEVLRGDELGSFETLEEALAFAKADDEDPEGTNEAAGEAPESEAQEPSGPNPDVLVEPTGGGWFAVMVPGEDAPRKVQGEAKLRELLAELHAEG